MTLGFSFLNHRDGGTIEILHTSDDPLDVEIEGAIVGVDGPPTRVPSPLLDDPSRVAVPFFVGIAIIAIGAFALAAAVTNNLILAFGVLAPGFLLAGYALLTQRREKRRIPEPLRNAVWPS